MKKFIGLLIIIFSIIITRSSAQNTPIDIQTAKAIIIGEWIRTDNSACKLVFTNYKQKYYINNQLIWEYNYQIDNTCNSNSLTICNNLLLISYNSNNEKISCDIIQNLKDNNNGGILSLTTEGQGKNIVYERPKN